MVKKVDSKKFSWEEFFAVLEHKQFPNLLWNGRSAYSASYKYFTRDVKRNKNISISQANRDTFLQNTCYWSRTSKRSWKWLLSSLYNPNTTLIADHLHYIGTDIDFYSSKYGNVIVIDTGTQSSNTFLGIILAITQFKKTH